VLPVRCQQPAHRSARHRGGTDCPSAGQTLQRCPDGAAPYDGYNYLTSGGGSSYFVGTQTEGFTNTGSCPVAVEATTWGQLKATYRQ
jgi:hypothetical protein